MTTAAVRPRGSWNSRPRWSGTAAWARTGWSAESRTPAAVMTRYQHFNFDTISIRYFAKYRDIAIDIFFNNMYANLIQAQEQDVNI